MYPGTIAKYAPEKPAVIMADTGERLTYAQLDARSTRLARVLRGAGLQRGDHIAFLSDNAPEVFEVLWAALRSGLYVTAVNHHLSADEAAYIVNDCEARVIVASAAEQELAEELVPRTAHVAMRLTFGGLLAGHQDYEQALNGASGAALEDQPRGADMLYSSGTTGRPKGIKPALPDRQVDEPGDPYVAVFGEIYGFDENTVYYSPAPIYHAAPLRFGAIVQSLGGTYVMTKKFDPEKSLELIERYRVTHSQWVPTMFVRMLKLDERVRTRFDVSSQSVVIHAAAPCPVDVKQKMMDWWGPILHEYYSSTEGNGITLIGPDEWLERRGSVGRAKLGTIHVCDDRGEELSAGEVGAVYFEREQVPFVYHNDEQKTREAQHPQYPNWTTTGDVGYQDRDGYLYLTDRKAFMIISGGVNIYPQEVEDCLTLHPKVLDVGVIGVPDPEMGEQVKAIVQPAPDACPGPELEKELTEFVRDRIAGYKVPRSIDFSGQLPRSATGKLVKRELREKYVQ